MSAYSQRPGAAARFFLGFRFRLGFTLIALTLSGGWLACRIVPRPEAESRTQGQTESPLQTLPTARLEPPRVPSLVEPAGAPQGIGSPGRIDAPEVTQTAGSAGRRPSPAPTRGFVWQLPPVEAPSAEAPSAAAPATLSVPPPPAPAAPFAIRPNPPTALFRIPDLPVVRRPQSPAWDDPPLPELARRNAKQRRIAAADRAEGLGARLTGGSGELAVWAFNGSGTSTVDIAALLGADRFYSAGYTGSNAHVANIEGGTPWRGHETMNWMPAGNIFWSGAGLNEGTNPTSTTTHATATSMNIVGKAPAGSTDPTLQRGIAYGVNPSQFFGGNIASTINGNTFLWSSYADFRNVYRRAIVEGLGPNNTVDSTHRVDVVNSSWSGDAVTSDGAYNLERAARNIDSILFEGNQTRGSTIVFSAGNNSGANTIGSPSTGFNMIVVGALGEFATDAAGTAVYNVATSFSSRGPIQYRQPTTSTDFSGSNLGEIRARVDIAAPGFQMRLATTGAATSYSNWSGTSFAAPTVAGGVALLADYAWSALTPGDAAFAVDGRVIRSVLINSADKTSGWSNGQAWNGTRWSTAQGLDYATGGGRMNLNQAFNQYANVAGNTITQLINPSGSGPHSVLATGWARATLNRPDSATAAGIDFLITDPLTRNSELNTTLTWFVNGASAANTSNPAVIGFHNLDLEVWLTDGSGVPQTRVGVSTADHNNVEHLSFLVPETGQYLIRVLRPSDSNGGTYYSFAGDSTSDVFGLAWMSRPGLQVSSGTTTISSGVQSHANVLVAPESGQTATLSISGSGTRVNVLNRLYVGGTDRGAGGTGTLTITSGAAVDASNSIDVFGGGTLTVTDSTLSGGVLSLRAGSNFTASGVSILQFSRIDAASPLVVPNGGDVTVRSYRNYSGANAGRLNLLSTAATLNVDGVLRLQPVLAGTSGLIKNGAGTVIVAPTTLGQYTYTGTTLINAGTLQLGVTDVLPNTSEIWLAGGTLRTGAAAGFSDTVGALRLEASSTISLGTGTHALTFSGLTGTPTGILTILGWTGAPLASGTAGDILFTGVGSTPAATYASFLSTVQFQGYGIGAATFILSSGSTYELVPTPAPEPAAILAVAFAGLGLGGWVARRARRPSHADSDAAIAT